jgi:hypothetical protein
MLGVVAIVQFILHYLGWLGVVLGVIALVFGNVQRASELIVGGLGMIAVKYLIGLVYVGLLNLGKKRES